VRPALRGRPRSVAPLTASDAPAAAGAREDFSVFTWFYALAVVFQLARGDMGLFASLRSTPGGVTLGDGPTAQLWFVCALVALATPRVWSLLLLACAGAFDFYWRLPIVSPSMFFNGLVTTQLLVTALDLAIRERTLRIDPAAFMLRLRPGMLALLVVLFFFAVFHKLTPTSIEWSAGFFHLMGFYYAPFLPLYRVPDWFLWLLTVVGEGAIFLAFLVPRTRALAVPLLIAFASFVGVLVYGFGSILLASAMSLAATGAVLEPLRGLRVTTRLREMAPPRTWRLVFVVAIAATFMIDHVTGFTLADRRWLFPSPDQWPGTADVLTPMQVTWFLVSATVLASALVATWRTHGAVGGRTVLGPFVAAWLVPAFLVVSEVGLYAGMKTKPNIAMFSGLTVIGEPNHMIVGDRLLTSRFHRDLLLVQPPWQEERIGTPVLSVKVRLERARRLGIDDPVVDAYRDGRVTRLRDGVEAPFSFDELDHVRSSDPFEAALPQRLFLEEPASESALRASMPELFAAPRPGAGGHAAGAPGR